ncbi:hypothetical protein DFH06DRAFT_1330945 [Mycena polygramma]|nr:hypothetical protein DFH06DRAFT_1330945 [Mycena polygramma]
MIHVGLRSQISCHAQAPPPRNSVSSLARRNDRGVCGEDGSMRVARTIIVFACFHGACSVSAPPTPSAPAAWTRATSHLRADGWQHDFLAPSFGVQHSPVALKGTIYRAVYCPAQPLPLALMPAHPLFFYVRYGSFSTRCIPPCALAYIIHPQRAPARLRHERVSAGRRYAGPSNSPSPDPPRGSDVRMFHSARMRLGSFTVLETALTVFHRAPPSPPFCPTRLQSHPHPLRRVPRRQSLAFPAHPRIPPSTFTRHRCLGAQRCTHRPFAVHNVPRPGCPSFLSSGAALPLAPPLVALLCPRLHPAAPPIAARRVKSRSAPVLPPLPCARAAGFGEHALCVGRAPSPLPASLAAGISSLLPPHRPFRVQICLPVSCSRFFVPAAIGVHSSSAAHPLAALRPLHVACDVCIASLDPRGSRWPARRAAHRDAAYPAPPLSSGADSSPARAEPVHGSPVELWVAGSARPAGDAASAVPLNPRCRQDVPYPNRGYRSCADDLRPSLRLARTQQVKSSWVIIYAPPAGAASEMVDTYAQAPPVPRSFYCLASLAARRDSKRYRVSAASTRPVRAAVGCLATLHGCSARDSRRGARPSHVHAAVGDARRDIFLLYSPSHSPLRAPSPFSVPRHLHPPRAVDHLPPSLPALSRLHVPLAPRGSHRARDVFLHAPGGEEQPHGTGGYGGVPRACVGWGGWDIPSCRAHAFLYCAGRGGLG